VGKDNKNKVIKFLVSDAEHYALTSKARIAGLSISEYMRLCGLGQSLSSVGCEQIRQFQRTLGQLAEELGGLCAILADAKACANASASIPLGDLANQENNILMVSAIYQERAFPIFWILFSKKGSSDFREQLACLATSH